MNCPWDFLVPQEYIFCEEKLCSWVTEPANAWTNVSYLIVAILIFRSKQKGTTRTFFLVSTFCLFLASTFFHVSTSKIGKYLDVSSMFVISSGVLCLALEKSFQWKPKQSLLFFCVSLVSSLTWLFLFSFGNFLFGLEIFLATILEFRMMKHRELSLDSRKLFYALLSLALAFLMWLLDVKRIFCWPGNHLLTGHGIWHLLAGLALWFLYQAHVKNQNTQVS